MLIKDKFEFYEKGAIMFSKKCDKKSHPYLAVMIGALAVVGAFAIKKCSMDFVKSKWCKLKNSMKNMYGKKRENPKC